MGITVGCQNFESLFTVNFIDFDDGNIECTAAEVVYSNLLVAFNIVNTVGKSCSCRFVDDTFNIKTCNSTGILGSLTLSIVEVCRYGNNCFCNLFTENIFSGLLHFLQNFCRNLRRGHFLALNFNPGVSVVCAYNLKRHNLFITLNFRIIITTTD